MLTNLRVNRTKMRSKEEVLHGRSRRRPAVSIPTKQRQCASVLTSRLETAVHCTRASLLTFRPTMVWNRPVPLLEPGKVEFFSICWVISPAAGASSSNTQRFDNEIIIRRPGAHGSSRHVALKARRRQGKPPTVELGGGVAQVALHVDQLLQLVELAIHLQHAHFLAL